MCFPRDSGRAATCIAAQIAAPHDSPARMPSRAATNRAVSIAASSGTGITSSSSSRFSTAGTKPAPIPWMRCGPGLRPDSTAEDCGSTAMICAWGLAALITSPAPVIVPPVPTPATSTSTLPSSARRISGPVPVRCASGFAGLENWSGRKWSASPASVRAASIASFMPPIDSTTSTRAP